MIDEKQQAITDLVNFIAEFELWLEGEVEDAYKYRNLECARVDRLDLLEDVLDKYRECKERIEKDDN